MSESNVAKLVPEKAAKIVIDTRVKDVAQSDDPSTRIASEFYDALNVEVEKLIKKAVDRAKANGRKTLQPMDL